MVERLDLSVLPSCGTDLLIGASTTCCAADVSERVSPHSIATSVMRGRKKVKQLDGERVPLEIALRGNEGDAWTLSATAGRTSGE
jgi:hypothetical protein